MLVRIGADHATAAPAPIRFSIRRLEIPSSITVHLLGALNSWQATPPAPERVAHGV